MSALARFWKRVKRRTKTQCWPWLGPADPYGRIRIDGRRWSTHRLSWWIHFGEIPKGLSVLHSCDNPPCCNPNHLWLGTTKDNMADMSKKGRAAKGLRHGTHTQPGSRRYGLENGSYTHPEKRVHTRGEKCGTSKITRQQMKQIRARYKPRKVTQRALAKEYGISQTEVCKIIHKERWQYE